MHPLGALTRFLTVCTFHLHTFLIEFFILALHTHYFIHSSPHSTSRQCHQTCLLHTAQHQHGGPITWCLPAALQGLIPVTYFLTLPFLTPSQLPCGFLLYCADQAAFLLSSVQQLGKRSTTFRQHGVMGQSGLLRQPAALAAACSS
jgi:hypothetical protein